MGFVGFEVFDIGGKGFFGEVGMVGVDGNVDGGSIKFGDIGGFEFSEGEIMVEVCLVVIFDGVV